MQDSGTSQLQTGVGARAPKRAQARKYHTVKTQHVYDPVRKWRYGQQDTAGHINEKREKVRTKKTRKEARAQNFKISPETISYI